jgi:plasmid stabilization system protein ParE
MPYVKYTERAIRDLYRLHGVLAEKSMKPAGRAMQAILKGLRLLGQHPEIGRPAEGLPPEFREWVISFGSGAYIVRYHYDGQNVSVLAIRHNREEKF